MYTKVFVVLLIVSLCNCVPLDSEVSENGEIVRTNRMARATCDLLSISIGGISVNHAACAAHCLAMHKGYKGGYCQNGVCHCRK